MTVLIDSNVVLDVLLDRVPFSEQAARLLELSEYGEIDAYVSASAVTDIYYIARKQLKDHKKTIELLKKLLTIIHIAGVFDETISRALDLDWKDFEDAVQYAAAEQTETDCVVTRNTADYGQGRLAVLSPENFLAQYD